MNLPFFKVLFSSTLLCFSAQAEVLTTKDYFLNREQAGCQPKGAKSDLLGKYLYVAEMCGHIPDGGKRQNIASVSIFDLETRKRIETIRTPDGAKPGIIGNTEVEMSHDNQWALVARAEGDSKTEVFPRYGMITVLNNTTKKIAKYIPTKGQGSKIVARRPMTQDGRQIIYVANYFSDDISVLDITNLQDDGHFDGSSHFIKKVSLKSAFVRPESKGYKLAPRGVAYTQDGKYAFILNTENGSIIIMDSIQHKPVAELPPIAESLFGREVNVRHIITTNDGAFAYLSHMRGNAVSKMSITKLVEKVEQSKNYSNSMILFDQSTWEDLIVPIGNQKLLVLENYPKDHPQFAGKSWDLAHPNTIVLDPINNKYLYVSHRTTSNQDYTKIDPKILGKVDVIDTTNGKTVISLVGGSQPTALEVTPDNQTLISGGFKDNLIYFYDLKKIISDYESEAEIGSLISQ